MANTQLNTRSTKVCPISSHITAELWYHGEYVQDVEVLITCRYDIGPGIALQIVKTVIPLKAWDIRECRVTCID